MDLSDQLFKEERYTYEDYFLWKGNWELVNGYPYAMAPSPNRIHQWFAAKFIQKVSNALDNARLKCSCNIYSELDWIIDDHSVLRTDWMIVCRNFIDDFLRFTPTLIMEISSRKTKLRGINTKYNLYELKGLKYYVIADTEKKSVEVLNYLMEKYIQKNSTEFQLTAECLIDVDVFGIWQLM